jgi:hypothetical protein
MCRRYYPANGRHPEDPRFLQRVEGSPSPGLRCLISIFYEQTTVLMRMNNGQCRYVNRCTIVEREVP